MSSRRFFLLATSLVALVLPASASGALFPQGEIRLATIQFASGAGYEVEISSARAGKRAPEVGLVIAKGPLTASYSVPNDPGTGLKAAFGSLGALDVRFQRRRKEIDRPEPNCRWVSEVGVFRGSFDFTGEGGYFSAHEVDLPGEVFRLPDGFCGLESFRRERVYIPGLYETVLAARMVNNARMINFEASRMEQARAASFTASLSERVGPMAVERTVRVGGAATAFSNSKTSRASVSPPPPFTGSAEFSHPATGPASWTGSLSVSFLGAPEVPLAGESFFAKLCPRLPFPGRCLRPRRDRSIR